MATCKQTAYELIQDVFSPCVAVLCSSDVDQVCAKNNLTFVQMIQPFCRLNTEATIRDSNNVPCAIKNFRVIMKHLHAQPPSPSAGKKMMHDAVSSNNLLGSEGILMNTLETENYYLKYCSTTPWFEAYREVFFQVTSSPEHEFIHNYLSCIFVVSSSHQDPLSQINELSQQLIQYQQSSHNSRWFFTQVLTYYLLVHDVSSEDLAKAEAVYQSMKSSFGSTSCHLLQINSTTGAVQSATHDRESSDNMPDPWSQFLPKYYVQNNISSNTQASEENHVEIDDVDDSAEGQQELNSIHHPLLNNSEAVAVLSDSLLGNSTDDVSGLSNRFSKSSARSKKHGLCLTLSDIDRIKCFVQDFCIQSLIPFVEKRVKILNEQVANRKGIHRTIFGVTKKFFGNKPGAQSPASSMNSVVYGPDAPELQVRKLGDLAFMFQLYELAYQAYHTAKRDFSADQAWLHFAGASEMAALSAFMQNNPAQEYPLRYIESAINTYLHPCKLPELAIRATLLSTECLKSKGMYKEAAEQFVRSPIDADLPTALCLEQAAYCYINCKPPKIRKYGFYVILAGHRFNKAGQRKHALRSYKQAEQIYRSIGWNFANNHISFTVGRLSIQQNQLESACSAYEPLLVSNCLLPVAEQSGYLWDYLFVLKRFLAQKPIKGLPSLPVPFVQSEATKVLLAEDTNFDEKGLLEVSGRGFDRSDINNNIWEKLEEIVVNRTLNNSFYYNQLQCFTSKTDNSHKPKAVVDETITVELAIKNPLSVCLTIENIYLLWTFIPQSNSDEVGSVLQNEPGLNQPDILNAVAETVILPKAVIEPYQVKKIHLVLLPKQTGEISITGITYNLVASTLDKDLNGGNTEEEKTSVLSIRGKQLFTTRGPRLNKTSQQRATKVYAEDNRLSISILEPLAKLQVKFQSFPYSFFCGEVKKVIAKLTNVGKHKLKRVIVASPTPGLFAIGIPGDINNPNAILKEITSSRQPSPVMSKWEPDWMIEILMPDGEPCALDPGTSIEIPVWFKGPEAPGDHDLDLLFYYESEPPQHKLRYRLLQFSCVIVTHPSVDTYSTAMRSFCSKDLAINFHPAAIPTSLILTMSVKNCSEELDQVSLIQISCISKNWCLLPSEETCRRNLSVIHSEESLMLSLKAIGFDPKTTVSSQRIKVFSHISLGRVEVDNSSTPWLDFSQKSGLDLGTIIASEVDTKAVLFPKDIYKLEIEQDIIILLVIIWKAKIIKDGKEEVIIGLQHVPIYNLAPSTVELKATSELEEAAAENQEVDVDQALMNVPSELVITSMLKCALNHSFCVQHDFSNEKCVAVPIEFIAHNTSDTELSIILDNSSHPDRNINASLPGDSYNQIPQRFTWVGGSKREFSLKPHTSVQLLLETLFWDPGTYNLSSSVNILVNSGKDNLSVYPMPLHLIMINSINGT
nr:trafficking protein particle complex subunit 8 isoform X2 [Parasteatoda tepidariorum]